jgi:hypothetical protein
MPKISAIELSQQAKGDEVTCSATSNGHKWANKALSVVIKNDWTHLKAIDIV